MDAVKDMDDALCLVHLFALFPAQPHRHLEVRDVQTCCRLSREFQHYVMRTRALSKVFISIKGNYYQARRPS